MISMTSRRAVTSALMLLLFALFGCENSTEPGPTTASPAPTPPNAERPDPRPVPPTSTDAPYLDRAIFPAVGETAFTTANLNEQLSTGSAHRAGANGRAVLDGDEAAAGEAAPNADPGAAPEAQPDPTREIVEADVFKLEGDLLYVLNRYRGLVIIDVSDPDALRIRGRLPFQAIPVEMYIREGRAYIVMSDHFVYWQHDADADPHGFHGSQVIIVDVDDPDAPAYLGNQAIDGEITDTRMVGDVLYTVSKRRPDYWRYNTADWEDTTWIASLNVADPENIREIEQVEFRGSSTLIHVAHHAIFVAAWDPNYYLIDPLNEQETLVTYVDISDPDGALESRGTVYVPGKIRDKFKMNWHDGVFRVFSESWNGDTNIELHLVPTAEPDQLEIADTLELRGVTRSGLAATRLSEDRAFAVTSEWNRNTRQLLYQLHTIDLSEGARQAATLRTSMIASHLEIHGDRLLAMGASRAQNQRNQAAVGLFDIRDLDAPRELSVSRLGEGYSGSAANGDYKAFKSFPAQNLVLIPLSYWDDGNRFNGVQIVEWADDEITERGRLQISGGIQRAFPVGDRLVAVGERTVNTIDANDLDAPLATDALHLLRSVHDVFSIGGHQVQIATNIESGRLVAETRAFGTEDDSPPLAEIELPFGWSPQVFRDGDVLHMIGYEQERGQVIRNLDLTNPLAPRLRGELALTDDAQRLFNQGMSFYATYWSPRAGLPLRNQILPATFRRIVENEDGRRDFSSELRLIDLRDVDNPRFTESAIPMNDYPFVNKVTHGEILYSSHVEQATTMNGESLLYHVRSYVDRIDVSNPDAPVVLPSVNIPGYLVDVSADGNLLYTVDYQWDDFGRRRNSVNVLRMTDDETAELVDVIPVGDQIHRAVRRTFGSAPENTGAGWADGTIWISAHKYPWWGVRGDTVESRQPYTVLRRLSFGDDGHLADESENTLAGYHFDLLDIEDGRAYLGSRFPSGLLVLDLDNDEAPAVESAARTIGYLSRIIVEQGDVYAPMGLFGLRSY